MPYLNLSLSDLRRGLKIDRHHNSHRQAIATPLRDDGLSLVLSAVVCLFRSWVGTDKGATYDSLSQEGVPCHSWTSQV